MKKFNVAVSYKNVERVTIHISNEYTLAQAIQWAKENTDKIPIPYNTEHVNDSITIDEKYCYFELEDIDKIEDYHSKYKTNYFSVTNESKLKEIIDSCEVAGEGELKLLKSKSGNKYSFCCDCNLYGVLYGLKKDEDPFEWLLKDLQKILPEDEAILLIEVESNNITYLTEICTIITKDKIQNISFYNKVLKTVRSMLQNSEFEIQLEP